MALITELGMERMRFASRLLKKSWDLSEIWPQKEIITPKMRQDFLRSVVSQLARRRYELGLTGLALDHKIGCAENLVAKWECGMRTPSAINLMYWAEALGCKWILVPTHQKRDH